jgi:hypothetical protein
MHTITKMAQPRVASHKLKHGFSCSIISRELAERYGFHVCIPCLKLSRQAKGSSCGHGPEKCSGGWWMSREVPLHATAGRTCMIMFDSGWHTLNKTMLWHRRCGPARCRHVKVANSQKEGCIGTADNQPWKLLFVRKCVLYTREWRKWRRITGMVTWRQQ